MNKTSLLSEGSALQPLVKQAISSKTESNVVNIIKQALSAPDIYVFGELLSVDSVKNLANKGGEAQQHFELLQIFAYGTYGDYLDKQSSLPKLTEKQAKKLKQLTIASLASDSHIIQYSLLLKELDIAGLRELEDLIIDALYKDIVVGKLDHEKQVFQVDSSLGRDLRPQDMDNMIETLLAWQQQSELLLKTIEDKMKIAQNHRTEAHERKREFEKKLEDAKSNIKIIMESEMANSLEGDMLSGELMGAMGMGPMGGVIGGMLGDRGGGALRNKQKGKQPGKGRHVM